MTDAYEQTSKFVDRALDHYFDTLVERGGEFGDKYRLSDPAEQLAARLSFKARALEASAKLLIAQYRQRLN